MKKYCVDIYYTNFGENKYFRSPFDNLEELLKLTNEFLWTMKKNGKFKLDKLVIFKNENDGFKKVLFDLNYDLF